MTESTGDVREAVFTREQHVCRCCRARRAESMHEMKPRSVGGTIGTTNSIAVCGSGTTGCHGYLQQHQIDVFGNANESLVFVPTSHRALTHLTQRPTVFMLMPDDVDTIHRRDIVATTAESLDAAVHRLDLTIGQPFPQRVTRHLNMAATVIARRSIIHGSA